MEDQEDGDFVAHLYEATIRPERFDALILHWDAQLAHSQGSLGFRIGGISSESFLHHVQRAISIIDELNAVEFQELDSHLAAVPRPAIVFSPSGAVVASNAAARVLYSLYPGGSVRSMAIEADDQGALMEALTRAALQAPAAGEILRCRNHSGRRDFHLHLRSVEGGRGTRHVLVVSSEIPWNDAVGAALEEAFALTEAEVAIVRRLLAGETVAEISAETGRRESTIRSQIHAILQKTGTESQAEVLRLASMLHTSLALDPPRRELPARAALAELPSRDVLIADGRRITVLRIGDPWGRSVIWLQSQLGFFTPTRAGEADLKRLGIRLLVPIRAGYGPSDPPPAGRDILEVAVEDTIAVMDALNVKRAPVVALVDDIWIALALAQREPDRIAGILGLGAGFPVTQPEHYRRLHPVGRFFRGCARHAPHLLPFLLRLIRARMLRAGLDSHARSNLRSPSDLEALDNPDIFDAWMGGWTYLYGTGRAPEAALCAELRRFHSDWPRELGYVACPVTLLHGEEDGNNPYETAREMAESYPSWKFIGRERTGQLILYTCWDDVLALLCRALEDGAFRPFPELPGQKEGSSSLDG